MTRKCGGNLPEAACDLLPVQANNTEFSFPSDRIDDDLEWDGAWIDLGGES